MLGLAPAAALACDEETAATAEAKVTAEAKATAVAKATASCKVTVEATSDATTCVVKVKNSCKEKNVTAVIENKCTAPKAVNTQGIHRNSWEPGHLIEPDSMKLGPDIDGPDPDQWVILSSRGGIVRMHKMPWTKKEGRTTYPVYGPYRIVLLPQLP